MENLQLDDFSTENGTKGRDKLKKLGKFSMIRTTMALKELAKQDNEESI
jgi:hypothetical protein